MFKEHEAHHSPARLRDESRRMQRTLARARYVLIGFLAVAAYFLFTEHREHTIAALPYLLILACPIMHIFMHRHHGHRHGGSSDRDGWE